MVAESPVAVGCFKFAGELRKPLGIQRHFRMVFPAGTLLQLNAMVDALTGWFKTNVKSLSGKCNIVKNRVIRSFIS
jgi:hypothetical protein